MLTLVLLLNLSLHFFVPNLVSYQKHVVVVVTVIIVTSQELQPVSFAFPFINQPGVVPLTSLMRGQNVPTEQCLLFILSCWTTRQDRLGRAAYHANFSKYLCNTKHRRLWHEKKKKICFLNVIRKRRGDAVYDVKGYVVAWIALSVACIPWLPYAEHSWESGPEKAG